MRKSSTPPSWLVRKRWRKYLIRLRRKRIREYERAIEHERRLRKMVADGQRPAIELYAPEVFTLVGTNRREAVAIFLRDLVRHVLIDNHVVCINFRTTKQFYADGTLLLYAELSRLLKRAPGRVRCVPPRGSVACQVLYHLKLFEMMGCRKEAPSTRKDVVNWQVFQGTRADAATDVGPALDDLPRLERALVKKLFRSVSEALTNVTQHAYMEPRKDGTGTAGEQSWWMFIREEPGAFDVGFTDLGVGIPFSVPRQEKHKSWLSSRMGTVARALGMAEHQDGELIYATVQHKRSRFAEEHRGNGFGNMIESIVASRNGRILIQSNRGAYEYRCEEGREKEAAYNYQNSIYGTVVGWHIELPKEN